MAKKRIFIIDDEEDLNRLLKLALEGEGDFEVSYESVPQKALEAARAFKPDVVLLDLVMPGMDGGELMFKLKGDEELRSVPVVFLTASIDPAADTGATLFGCRCLKKPAGLDEVIECLEACLEPGSE